MFLDYYNRVQGLKKCCTQPFIYVFLTTYTFSKRDWSLITGTGGGGGGLHNGRGACEVLLYEKGGGGEF